MFTGIIETTGQVKSVKKNRKSMRLTVVPKKKLPRVKMGESIAVNGVCLTVVTKNSRALSFDVVPETFRRSNLAQARRESHVNLERSLKYGDRISGHYVLGHVEATGRLERTRRLKREVAFRISFPKKLKRRIIPKGCIAVDGISLTVGEVAKNSFTVYLVPHTIRMTNLKDRKAGDRLNLETDILLKNRKFQGDRF